MMAKRDIVVCTCTEKDVTTKKNNFNSKTLTGVNCDCFVGSETKKQKLVRFKNVKVVVQSIKV